MTLEDLAIYCDAFYIGATKNGGLLGEAIVFPDPQLAEGFHYYLKQKGALLAKGRILGAQFYALLETGLFFDLGRQANKMAKKLTQELINREYRFAFPPTSNQIFPILSLTHIERLKQNYDFYVWKNINSDAAVVRLVCSWATPEDAVEKFIADLDAIVQEG